MCLFKSDVATNKPHPQLQTREFVIYQLHEVFSCTDDIHKERDTNKSFSLSKYTEFFKILHGEA